MAAPPEAQGTMEREGKVLVQGCTVKITGLKGAPQHNGVCVCVGASTATPLFCARAHRARHMRSVHAGPQCRRMIHHMQA